jgi:prepilin-type N-terminal cleavage/methylation domain-containing protein
MTLIEVMIALAIITTSMLGLGAFLPNLVHGSANGTILPAASALAVTRIQTITVWPAYSSLAPTFNATETTGLTGPAISRDSRPSVSPQPIGSGR